MKKIRNDRSAYLSRSALARPVAAPPKESKTSPRDRGDFRVDATGYFVWPKRIKVSC